MNNNFKTSDPNQRRLFGTGDIRIIAGARGGRNAICWKSIEIWSVFCVLSENLEDNNVIDKARHHENTEVRRLNRVKWCKHICDAQTEVGPRKAWDSDNLPRGWPTIKEHSRKSIPLNDLTEIILEHRDRVILWNSQRIAVVPEVVHVVPEVVPDVVSEPEFNLDSGVDNWEDL